MPASESIQKLRTNKYKSTSQAEYTLTLDYVPQPPPDLTEEACIFWTYYCELLIQGGCLRRTYITSLHNLCLAHVLRSEYVKHINTHGIITEEAYIDSLGYPQVRSKHNPICDKLSKCLLDMDRLLASMGMTAYTDKLLQYDGGGGNILKGKTSGPPAVALPSPKSTTS